MIAGNHSEQREAWERRTRYRRSCQLLLAATTVAAPVAVTEILGTGTQTADRT